MHTLHSTDGHEGLVMQHMHASPGSKLNSTEADTHVVVPKEHAAD